MNPAPEVMDKEQCAAYLGVGTTTIERWRDTEGLPYSRVGHITRYRRAAVDAWLAARETTNHPAPTPPRPYNADAGATDEDSRHHVR